MRRRFTLLAAAIAAAAVLAPTAATVPPVKDSSWLRDAVTVDGIREHQAALQQIADANSGTRASGTSGYDVSVEYVVQRLTAAGYRPQVQEFEFAFFQQLSPSTLEQVSPNALTYVEGPESDFETMEYSADGEVTGTLVPTLDVIVPMDPNAPPSTSNSGCEPEDFTPADDTELQVALIQRGTCTFEVKAANAAAAGYDAILFFNEGQPGRTAALAGTLGGPAAVPAVFATYALGAALFELTQAGPVTVHIETDTISETRTTANVIAETRGRAKNTIVVGAHLDSVLDGPGINDNGSGSAAILEIAEELGEVRAHPKNKLRFIWFGAEENVLLGSEHYVGQLSAEDLEQIALMLNFDMIGSLNYVRFVYDGDGSAGLSDPGPPGSDVVEQTFLEYFGSQGLATEPTAFDGRSDYGPFIAAGIPSGGLFTGAEGVKTAEQVAIYGGTAGEQYDPCYHQACDTFDNVSLDALDQMSDAAAHAIYTFASRNQPLGHGG